MPLLLYYNLPPTKKKQSISRQCNLQTCQFTVSIGCDYSIYDECFKLGPNICPICTKEYDDEYYSSDEVEPECEMTI